MTTPVTQGMPKEKYVPSDKEKHRARNIFREMLRQTLRESAKHGQAMTESIIRNSLRDRAKRNKVAKARGIKPGSKRWDALFRNGRWRSQRS